ncbi:ATP synthase F1 subunit gamma [Mycoplasma sp. 128]|uniref:ATP synthase F1 subunit gamma n=1 Tax=Mycoplasma sp. 3341 TaxID=3447506 RepID=UPI003F65F487
MADLLGIKHRIESVTTTKKITKAMELVATAKIAKIKTDFNKINVYYDRVMAVFDNILLHAEDINKILNSQSPKDTKPQKLYIVIGSDLGLCGAYNANLYKMIRDLNDEKPLFIVLGSKILNFLNEKYGDQVIQSFIHVGDSLDYSLTQIISQKIYDVIQKVHISEVNIIYTQYINSITTEPKIKQIFPLQHTGRTQEINRTDLSIYEPSATKILASSFIIYFEASIYLALAHAKLSETSARRTAMENATDNANELIGELQLNYNRSRQAKITQEITEIISGSNS